MKDPDQIAAEAAKDFCLRFNVNPDVFLFPLTKAFQSAIEKAHEDGYVQGARAGVLNERESHAAHASERPVTGDPTFVGRSVDKIAAHASEPTCKCVQQGYPEQDCKWHGEIVQGQNGYTNWIRKDECQEAIEKATKETQSFDCIFCGRGPHPDSYGHSYRPRKET